MQSLSKARMVDLDLHRDSTGQLRDDVDRLVWSCGDCSRLWTSMQQAHCTGCHQHFSSDSAFDLHTVAPPPLGPRPFKTCKTADELMGIRRLTWAQDRFGGYWARPGSPPEGLHAPDG